MAVMNAGDRNREITIQNAAHIQLPSGDDVLDWDHAIEQVVWAQWLPGDTRETWRAQQRLTTYIEGVFVTDYELDPMPIPDATRIVYDGRVYDVKPWVEIGLREGLEIPVVAHAE